MHARVPETSFFAFRKLTMHVPAAASIRTLVCTLVTVISGMDTIYRYLELHQL